MKRRFDLLTFINEPQTFPNEIDFPDNWGESPVLGEVLEIDGLLPTTATEFLFEEGKVLVVERIESIYKRTGHERRFYLALQ